VGESSELESRITLGDFYAHMPSHQYLFVPTRELWPASSVNGRLPPVPGPDGKPISPTVWLDANRPVEQLTWHPALPSLIDDQVLQASGWIRHGGAHVFNLYTPPTPHAGDATQAQPWRDHLARIYPGEAEHIECWLAHRLQYPGEKINHALVLGGVQGIGKDTLLVPIVEGVGKWNWSEISPQQLLGRFNGWCKAVVVRVSEARDLGDVDRFAFYDHSKAIIAAPPDVIRCDEKNMREHPVPNVCGVIITTNHKTDGIYLPLDDRRHYVAWSEATRENFAADYWITLYQWFEAGGVGHVLAYLRALDLKHFDPKAPPPKTPAFWSIVQANEPPESGELRDVLELLGMPKAVTIQELAHLARSKGNGLEALADELLDRKGRRSIPHKMERVGYVPVRNPDAEDQLFKVQGRRMAVYAQRALPLAEQLRAARLRCK
jgi:hypothetical protein